MATLVVTEFVTLDGVMEAPGGEPGHRHSGWVFDHSSDEQDDFKFKETMEADAQLIGRVTYESFAGAWPNYQGEFAERMNSMPKYVVTATLEELEWENCTPISGDIPAEVAKLKDEVDGMILVAGSRTLVHELLREGLVDELRMMVFPVAVGSGDRLFPDSPEKLDLEFADSVTFESGVQVNTFRPKAG